MKSFFSNGSRLLSLLSVCIAAADSFTASLAFCIRSHNKSLKVFSHDSSCSSSRLFAADSSVEDDISRQLLKARALLVDAKAKLAAKEKASLCIDDENAPSNSVFDASTDESSATNSRNSKRDKLIKSKSESTGLITTDGELMAALSAEEEWEIRPLSNESDSKGSTAAHLLANRQLATRDVAMSIFNLKRSMNKGDYERIFDTKNYFIGEDF